jgi:hypothetical protein
VLSSQNGYGFVDENPQPGDQNAANTIQQVNAPSDVQNGGTQPQTVEGNQSLDNIFGNVEQNPTGVAANYQNQGGDQIVSDAGYIQPNNQGNQYIPETPGGESDIIFPETFY